MALRRPSALIAATALVLGASVAPCAAFADGATAPTAVDITTPDLVSALAADAKTTADAQQGGWSVDADLGQDGAGPSTVRTVYAVSTGLVALDGTDTMIEVQHEGYFVRVADVAAQSPHLGLAAALKAIARPQATWILSEDKSFDLLSGDLSLADGAPDQILSALADPTQTQISGTPTETVAEDGSTTYAFSATDLTDDGSGSGTVSVTVDPDGRLTSFHDDTTTENTTATVAYGPQHVDVPAPSTYVTQRQLAEGAALAGMAGDTKTLAHVTASRATTAAHRHDVKVGTIRSVAAALVKSFNRAYGVKTFAAQQIAGGVRLVATNPFTHAGTTYTVTAQGTKAVVRQG